MQVNPVINIDRLHNSTLGTINTMVHDAEMNSRNQERRTHVPLANNTLPSPGRAVIHHTSTSSIPTRLHIPPSPPFNPNLNISNQYHQRQGQLPTVPNLYIGAVPGSPIPVVSDIGQDSTIFSTSSPYLRATKSAVDHAIANERDRISNLEQQEVNYTTIEEFKIALKKERQHSKHLVTDLAALKSIAVASTLEAEVNEEGRINCLMRRLDGLQKEKGRIIVELEREEEMLTNTLQKKLNQVRKEKESLEHQIEREHMLNARLLSAATNVADIPDAIGEEIDEASSRTSRAISMDTSNTSSTTGDTGTH